MALLLLALIWLAYWFSATVVAYTYLGYPALLWLLARWRPRPPRHGPCAPFVSIIVAAHNEEQQLAAKLEDLLALDYPAEQRELIVVSDGSTDATAAIATQYAERGVQLAALAPRAGKPTALNHGVARARGEIILFCDVRQRLAPPTLRALLPAFADPQVGAVSAELALPAERGPGLYWRYERALRRAESTIDSTVGATGACYAIRRALYQPLPASCLLDDVFTPLQIAMRGYRVLLEPGAQVQDVEAPLAGEFARKTRTLAGNYQLLQQLPGVLDPRRNRLLFQLVSHKLLRLLCPFALLALLVANLGMLVHGACGRPWYLATLLAQLALYALAARAAWGRHPPGPIARACHTFVVLNAAAVAGLWRFLTGQLGWTTHRA